MESNNISFKTQEKEIIIHLQNRPMSNKNQNKLLHKNFILVELYLYFRVDFLCYHATLHYMDFVFKQLQLCIS